MIDLFHVVILCSPLAAGAARPTMQQGQFTLQPTPAVEDLRVELRKLCEEDADDITLALTKLETELNSSSEALPVLAEACNCSGRSILEHFNRQYFRTDVVNGPLRIALKKYTSEAVPFLDALLSDQATMVRTAAADALATSVTKFDHNARTLMNRTLATDSDVHVRMKVAEALVQAVRDLGENATDLIMEALHDKRELVREIGVRAVDAAWRQRLDPQMRFANKPMWDSYEGVRQAFAGAPLGTAVDVFGTRATWMFKKSMSDTSTDVRNAAAQTLAAKVSQNSTDAITIFKSIINTSCDDADESEFWWRKSERGPECLVAATAAGMPLAAAVQTLGGDALPFVLQALKREEPGVRELAAGRPLLLTIMNMSFESASNLTMPMLNDADERVREAAGAAAAWVKSKELEQQKAIIMEEKMKAQEAADIASAAKFEAMEQANRTKAALQEAVISQIKAEANAKELQRAQETVYRQNEEVAKTLLQTRVTEAELKKESELEVMKMELKRETEAIEEEREQKKVYMNLFLGACLSAAVAVLPLLAKALYGAVRGERAD